MPGVEVKRKSHGPVKDLETFYTTTTQLSYTPPPSPDKYIRKGKSTVAYREIQEKRGFMNGGAWMKVFGDTKTPPTTTHQTYALQRPSSSPPAGTPSLPLIPPGRKGYGPVVTFRYDPSMHVKRKKAGVVKTKVDLLCGVRDKRFYVVGAVSGGPGY